MIDSQTVFAEAVAVTAIGTDAIGSAIDTGGAALGDAGQTQENLWVNVLCSTTATSGGSATIAAVLQDSPDNSTWTTRYTGPTFTLPGTVNAGTVLAQFQPPPGLARYWRVAIAIGAAVLTAGAFDAYISNTIQRNVSEPSGFSVS